MEKYFFYQGLESNLCKMRRGPLPRKDRSWKRNPIQNTDWNL